MALVLMLGLVLLAVLWVATPGAVAAQERQELPPELEARAHALYREIMCPTCIGQTIGQSRAPIANNMRQIVRERLLAGDSNEQILGFFSEAYGESILASPPRDGVALGVWLAPPVALALGGLTVFMAVKAMRRPVPETASSRWLGDGRRPDSIEEDLDPYLRLVDQEMSSGAEGWESTSSSAPNDRT